MKLLIRQPQGQPLTLGRDEIALAIAPRVRAGVTDGAPRERLNYFPGRALTAPALAQEQRHRAFHLAQLNRTLSPGVVDGFELAFEPGSQGDDDAGTSVPPPAALDLLSPRRLRLAPGLAVAANGEEVELPAELGFDLLDVPVVGPGWMLDNAPPPTGSENELLSRRVGPSLRDALAEGLRLPMVGALVMQPIEFDLLLDPDGGAARSQCERDPEAEAFDDEVRQEGARLLLVLWPDEWLALPARSFSWRNELAHQVFARESELGLSETLPWWHWGVPLALLGFNQQWQPAWIDSAAVRRRGGAPRAVLPRMAGGTVFLWQARVDQLSGHLADLAALGAHSEAMARQLRWLPPCGLLPRSAVDARRQQSLLLPATVTLDAAPVPLEQLDALMESVAPCAPVDLGLPAALRVLVPVPQDQFEPDLLVVEVPDAEGSFARTLDTLIDRRADQLRRRFVMRDRAFALATVLVGSRSAVALNLQADPSRLEDESTTPAIPAPRATLHLSANLSGMHQHFLLNTTKTFTAQAGETLFAWVLINPEAPPRQIMLQWWANGQWEQRAFWGEDLINWGAPGTPSRQRIGNLPTAGQWTRLEVKPEQVGLADRSVTGMAFTLFDGQALWGPAGALGLERESWLDDVLDEGSGQRFANGDSWDFLAAIDAGAPFEPMVGTVSVRTARMVEVARLLAQDAAVGALRIGPRGSQQSVAEVMGGTGLVGAVDALRKAIERSNDHIDFGFLRVQADMYRLRQSVLKQSQATRFAVSPALSQIADLDSPSATREQLNSFFGEIKGKEVTAPRAPAGAPAMARTASEGAGEGASEGASEAAAARGVFDLSGPPIAADAVSGGLAIDRSADGGVLVGAAKLGSRQLNLDARRSAAAALNQRNIDLGLNTAEIGNILAGDALTGVAEVRNVTIAARMEQPRAVENKNFGMSTRVEVTQRLLDSDLDLSDLQIAGVPDGTLDAATGQPKRKTMRLLDLTDVSKLLTDPSPDATKADEAHYFLGGVDVADYTIGLLRNFEGLTARYRAALARCEQALAQVQAFQQQGLSRLREIDTALAETRQDVATARALLAEEIARVNATNARRDAVIARHVRFLAFVRPLAAPLGARSPTRALDNAFEPDAVPQCLADHGAPPPELQAMVAQLRRAPVQWFTGLYLLPSYFVQPQQVRDLIVQLQADGAAPVLPVASNGAIATVIQNVRQQFEGLRSSKKSLVIEPQMGVVEQREQAFMHVALDDLSAFTYLAPLQRFANTWYDRVASVAGCLHARLSQVKPSLRLVWAQAFSSFDGPVELGDLSSLPRLHELPQELRDDIVELAAWLRRQAVASNPLAQGLMNTLVRVCLLAASASPTNSLITGSVLRPIPLLPLAVLPILPNVVHGVYLGQRVELFEQGRMIAQGLVHNLQGQQADVRVERTFETGKVAGPGSTVRFLP